MTSPLVIFFDRGVVCHSADVKGLERKSEGALGVLLFVSTMDIVYLR
jgi:hypothetical protein